MGKLRVLPGGAVRRPSAPWSDRHPQGLLLPLAAKLNTKPATRQAKAHAVRAVGSMNRDCRKSSFSAVLRAKNCIACASFSIERFNQSTILRFGNPAGRTVSALLRSTGGAIRLRAIRSKARIGSNERRETRREIADQCRIARFHRNQSEEKRA